jgi:hypothetical protein
LFFPSCGQDFLDHLKPLLLDKKAELEKSEYA